MTVTLDQLKAVMLSPEVMNEYDLFERAKMCADLLSPDSLILAGRLEDIIEEGMGWEESWDGVDEIVWRTWPEYDSEFAAIATRINQLPIDE